MNPVNNLKSTQLRKLFKLFKYHCMQSLNIFGARESFLFEFASLSRVWKFENRFFWVGPTCQRPVSVLTTQYGRSVPRAALFLVVALIAQRALDASGHRSSPPHVGWPPLSLLRMSPRKLPPTPLHSSTIRSRSSLLCYAPAATSPAIACRWWAASELSDRTKGSALSPCPSCTKNLPASPSSKARPRDSPTVFFLHEHIAGGSLL
jgi:hypothetical protein